MFSFFFFFFNDTATTEIYTLSLHDALPIPPHRNSASTTARRSTRSCTRAMPISCAPAARSEEHPSELQSRLHLVCRLLLEKKNKIKPVQLLVKQKHNKTKEQNT